MAIFNDQQFLRFCRYSLKYVHHTYTRNFKRNNLVQKTFNSDLQRKLAGSRSIECASNNGEPLILLRRVLAHSSKPPGFRDRTKMVS